MQEVPGSNPVRGTISLYFTENLKNWHYLIKPLPPFFYEYLSQKLPKNMIHVNGTQKFANLDFREVCTTAPLTSSLVCVYRSSIYTMLLRNFFTFYRDGGNVKRKKLS